MRYKISPEDICSITQRELSIGTTRLLPEWDKIPSKFKRQNCYSEYVAILIGEKDSSEFQIKFKTRFEGLAKQLFQVLISHSNSYQMTREHVLSGLGYLVSKIAEVSGLFHNS